MKFKIILTLAGIVISIQQFSAQCSQCKLLTEQGSKATESSFGSNINMGIVYLMVIPYLMLMFLFRKQIARYAKGFFWPAKQK